ncbi:LAME_0B07294g1_1 [Lachancea meyersii CBS 8951]|uniref:LAME_0B07294g1_1 n=1 Tax=Lachancea meyersii CBS 8951 TaxID=1266667 RepID=A0A1G4IWL7_9SACH|nr:LAME_0B07294g1_1 [Lachancea meyersii CBS 8951]
MISSTTWVPRGFPSEFPEKYELDDEEMERINQLAQLNLEDAKDAEEDGDNDEADEQANDALQNSLNGAKLAAQGEADDDLAEYDLEHHNDEDLGEGTDATMFPGLSDEVKYHEGENGEDAYMTLPTEEDAHEAKEELQVYPSDNMVLATRTEDDISYLDVYVYDDGAGFHDPEIGQEAGDEQDPDVARGLVRDSALYVHHDLMLPAFPLCVEWLNYKPGSNSDDPANFAAIGSFDPQIEIWNLDCVEKAFPDMILGDPQASASAGPGKSKKNKKTKSKHVTTHHTDAVLSLAHSKHFRPVLASSSADKTVKLWDLNEGVAARSIAALHSNKNVSAIQWHNTSGSVLLSGGYDSRAALSDVRIADNSNMSKYWSVMSGEEIECVQFADENTFMCGTDSGNVYSFDIRQGENSSPLWTLNAHDAGISTLNVNPFIPNLLATGAMGEKTVKLWKCGESGPSMVLSRDFGVGNVLSTSFAPDIEVAGNIVIGGVSKGLKLWDVFTNRSIRKNFGKELASVQKQARQEAHSIGKASRIARKYTKNDNPDTVVTVDDQGEDEEENEGREGQDDWEDAE